MGLKFVELLEMDVFLESAVLWLLLTNPCPKFWIRVQHDIDLNKMAEHGETWQMMKLRDLEACCDWYKM
jgi:hypothetical protein